MATVRPFRGIAFDPTRAPDLGPLTCPPYDVISPDDRERLYARHPYNVVRIVSGKQEPGDTPDDNRYTRAAEFFRSWLWERELRRDPEPALYVYRQAFTDPAGSRRRVWGLLATISLDDTILAHEKTMPGPKADRLALMRAVPANLSPIYALYREQGASVSRALPDLATGQPVADFADDEGVRHAVWAVHDPAFHESVAKALADSPLLVADGHHRFETAKSYRAERNEPGQWDDIMALLVDAGAEPVCILPYHRIVRRAAVDDVLQALEAGFEISALGPVTSEAAARLGLELWDEPRPGVFVALAAGHAYRLVARETGEDEIPAGILKRLALEPLGARFAEDDLSFSPSAEEVASEVAAGNARAGFLMQPVDVERVWDLAASGATMPEKSTYFFPKPRDGIVMRPLD